MTCPTPRKVAHVEHGSAMRHMRELQHGRWGRDLNVYRCICGSFHVGHDVRRLTYRIRQARKAGRA
jgi:hypothetical protein